MAKRINRCIELLAQDQAIYYDGPHSGHVLTHAQGAHRCRDLGRLHQCRHGARLLRHGGPCRISARHGAMPGRRARGIARRRSSSRRRSTASMPRMCATTPGSSARSSGRGVHGILLCQAETADAVRAFVESCRYPHNTIGVDPAHPVAAGAARRRQARRPMAARTPSAATLGVGTRGRGSESTAAPVWGLSTEDYMDRCDPWPLNPKGELLLGVKLESPEGVANCEEILRGAGPRLCRDRPGRSQSFARLPHRSARALSAGDAEARDRVLAACRKNGVAFLQGCTPG